MKKLILRIILFALTPLLRLARKKPAFAKEMSRYSCTVQIKLMDNSIGRHYSFSNGKVTSAAGINFAADATIAFKDLETALAFLKPDPDMAQLVHCAKNFKVLMMGRSELLVWFTQLVNLMNTQRLQMGTPQKDGSVRMTTITNGGPLFVYVKDNRIVRLTPIDFDENDAASWTIKARGLDFTPWRRATVAPHALAMKSVVYSEKRLLYPMKRVDFDPNGNRNPQNRGKSGYERISWEDALTIVASEINRQKRVHGPGSIVIPMSSHHQWGNVGYYLSALMRFGNLIGFTRMAMNPDSWEGWYWGAQHHYGNSMRVGIPGNYGTVEDCLREAELIVFWSSDPESTNSAYMGFEGTQRRFWAKKLGIEFVHIDPHFNATAQLFGGKWLPIRPTTDPALALAIMHVWVVEDLYDKEYVARCTTGFAEWRDYLLGIGDGIPKTPEWQEAETGVAAKDVRALARKWAHKKTYLAPGTGGSGFGGACRGATGAQWARSMILMMAMQGWGKPGINMGNLQAAAPIDLSFYFPGYADGGISGELQWNANAVNNYQRMPHILTMNPVRQLVPRQQFPDAIIEGKATGYLWDGTASEIQFAPYTYPMPGYSRIHMIYRYGGSYFSTMTNAGRMADAYRHESIEFVVNQSIYNEGEALFADIALPACTSFERFDIGEWGAAGGYVPHGFNALNHRVIALQHKCIEPLGESKSDYRIFTEILNRLGLGAIFAEGCSELDWCKRVFKSSDVAHHMSWGQFVKKGYFVVPAEKEALRAPVNMRWFAEGRPKDIPEALPLPSQYAKEFLHGLPTPSGKIEFIPEILKRADPGNPERPVLNKYISSWEGPRTLDRVAKYPLQMIATHSRYSFHTNVDGKDSFINDIEDHRALIDGHYYWLLRMSPVDAGSRSIKHRDLIKVYNNRGAVICAADVASMIIPGVVKSFESSAEYQPRVANGETVDIGGCMNLLTSSRSQMKGTSSMSPNSCLVQVEKWARGSF